MSYETRFMFAAGLSKTIHCPAGTFDSITGHVLDVERSLHLKRVRYNENPVHWEWCDRFVEMKDDDVLCRTVMKHNQWVHTMWHWFGEWSKSPVKDGEKITPAKAKRFWHALTLLSVEPGRWSKDYYRDRMECLYEVMRGRNAEGISFDDLTPLTPEQASAVITLFSEFLDKGDIRLAVPNGCDHLKASYDGGYDWCEEHGAIDENDFYSHAAECRHFRDQYPAEFEDEEEDAEIEATA
jgi:hypothetical protein